MIAKNSISNLKAVHRVKDAPLRLAFGAVLYESAIEAGGEEYPCSLGAGGYCAAAGDNVQDLRGVAGKGDDVGLVGIDDCGCGDGCATGERVRGGAGGEWNVVRVGCGGKCGPRQVGTKRRDFLRVAGSRANPSDRAH